MEILEILCPEWSINFDSGGFQVMSQVKKGIVNGKIKDEGIVLYPGKIKTCFFSGRINPLSG